MDKRIFITGPSGMGKTTIAKYIEAEYDIPFISTSAKTIWPEYGFANHQDAHRVSALDPKIGLNYQLDVLNNRIKALFTEEEFVCDRSPLDNFVYFMLELAPYVSEKETEQFIEKCKQAMQMGTGLIMIPYHSEIRLDDGMRIQNRFYHQLVSIVEQWALWGKEINICQIDKKVNLNHWDLVIRKNLVDEWIKKL